MALTLATISALGNAQVWSGGIGVNANDVVVQTNDVTRFNEFLLCNTAGAVQVLASLDGTNYMTGPVSMQDLGSASLVTSVIVTAANRIYRIRGVFALLKVTQNGAAAATGVTLLCSRKGGQP